MQWEAPRKIKTKIMCTPQIRNYESNGLSPPGHLGSHSEDKTNECGTEGDQRKDDKADKSGLVPS